MSVNDDDDNDIVGYDADSDNGFVIEEDTSSSVDGYDCSNYLSDNFSEEEEKYTKIKFLVTKKTKQSTTPRYYTNILQEEDDFI